MGPNAKTHLSQQEDFSGLQRAADQFPRWVRWLASNSVVLYRQPLIFSSPVFQWWKVLSCRTKCLAQLIRNVSKKESFLFKPTLYFLCTLPNYYLPPSSPTSLVCRRYCRPLLVQVVWADPPSLAAAGSMSLPHDAVVTNKGATVLGDLSLWGTEKAEHQWGPRKTTRKYWKPLDELNQTSEWVHFKWWALSHLVHCLNGFTSSLVITLLPWFI